MRAQMAMPEDDMTKYVANTANKLLDHTNTLQLLLVQDFISREIELAWLKWSEFMTLETRLKRLLSC